MGWYRKVKANLVRVPNDIPPDSYRVYLSENSIIDIEAGVFSQLNKCLIISLDNNEIREVRKAQWSGLSELWELDLSHNSISYIESKAFSHIENLRWLHLNHNKLTKIVGFMWQGLNSLEWLYLDHNSISSIKMRGFFYLTKLRRLYLNNNNLTQVKRNMWEGLETLRFLNLGNNSITFLERRAFSYLKQCSELYLSGNQLTEVSDETWSGLGELQHLILTENYLAVIKSDSFSQLSELVVLVLESNRIHDVETNSFPHRLMGLNLRNNNLTTMSKEVFPLKHPVNVTLALGGNPLMCDENLFWIKQGEMDSWINFLSISVLLKVYSSSSSPPECANLPNIPWNHVKLKPGEHYVVNPAFLFLVVSIKLLQTLWHKVIHLAEYSFQ